MFPFTVFSFYKVLTLDSIFIGYMTIQTRTTQIPTIQILKKIFKRLYLKK